MDNGRVGKTLFYNKLDGRIKVAKLRLRWLEDVGKDVSAMNIKRWRQRDRDI